MEIKRYEEKYANQVIMVIRKNLMEINSRDYDLKAMIELSETFTVDRINKFDKKAHFYVVVEGEQVLGCGGIQPYWDSKEESILRTIFVLPNAHGKGIGKLIMNTLENDEYYIRASRIEIPASITALNFYLKFGYDYKEGIKELDESNHYKLEKYKQVS